MSRLSLHTSFMSKCQVQWKTCICFFFYQEEGHFFMTIDVTLVSTHNSWTFSNTVPRNEKHFPLFSCGIQQHSNTTTAAQGPNEFFLLLIWLQKPFHLYKIKWNLNCLFFRKYIYFPVCLLLLFQFFSEHTNFILIFKIHLCGE